MPEPGTNDGNTGACIDPETDFLVQTERDHRRIIQIATTQLNKYLGINADPPKLEIRTDEGPGAQTGHRNGEEIVVLRPKKYSGRGHVPTGVTLHEVGHYLEGEFLGLDPNRKYATAWYLSEGFAEFIRIDDPANIRPALSVDRETGSYERIRREIEEHTSLGQTLIEHLVLDKLFAVRQPDLEADELPENLENKAMVPYWVGSSLVRFIVEKGGIQALREIMREVQIQKNLPTDGVMLN